jgi:hypothetical protein
MDANQNSALESIVRVIDLENDITHIQNSGKKVIVFAVNNNSYHKECLEQLFQTYKEQLDIYLYPIDVDYNYRSLDESKESILYFCSNKCSEAGSLDLGYDVLCKKIDCLIS